MNTANLPSCPPPGPAGWPRMHPFVGWILLVLLVVAIYSPALTGPKLWDDRWLVEENPFFRSPAFLFESFRHYLFLDSSSRYFRPVQNGSYILDYALWGDSVFAFHATNMVLHATAAFLLWRVLRRLLARHPDAEAVSLGVALAWSIHPIHSAAVAYISGRADPLAAMFVLAAWGLLYRTGGRGWIFNGAFPFLLFLGLGSKEIASVWILLLLIFAGTDRSIPCRVKWKMSGLCAAALAAYLFLRLRAVATVSAAVSEITPMLERVCLMLRAIGDYALLIVYPAGLTMDRVLIVSPSPLVASAAGVRGELLGLVGAALLPLMVWFAVRRDNGLVFRRFGLVWFWVAFLPVSNLFPLNAQSAEHWIYAASIGMLLLLAGIAWMLPPAVRRAGAVLFLAALIALGVRTWNRAQDWADPERFYRSMIAAGGEPVRAYVNLAELLCFSGRREEAEKIAREVVAKYPNFAPGWGILGRILNETGRPEEARQWLSQGEAQRAATDLGQSRGWQVRMEKAHAQTRASDPAVFETLDGLIGEYPGLWAPVRAKSILLELAGDSHGAIREVAGYVERNRWHYEATMRLATLLETAGKPGQAANMAGAALWLDIHAREPREMVRRLRGE